MNRYLLVDALVRQTMVMIAQLATSGGVRTPLAHLANQVFMDLTKELQAHGLGRKIIADMFGLTLRAYHAKVRRVTESASDRGRSLWEAIVDYLEKHPSVQRQQILRRFGRDDHAVVASVLNDLVDSGLVFRAGDGPTARYRIVDAEEITPQTDGDGDPSLAAFVWVTVYREGPLDRTTLRERLPLVSSEQLDQVLLGLEEAKRVHRAVHDGQESFSSDHCVIPIAAAEGWEAAVFDHFQAMVNAICAKVRSGRTQSALTDLIGGSTFHFDIDETHPLRDEVCDFFRRTRVAASELRERVEQCGAQRSDAPPNPFRVTFYAGQHVRGDAAGRPAAAGDRDQ